MTILEDFTIHPRAKATKCRSIGTTLGEVYGSWSHNKQLAYDYCVRLCKKYDGEQFAITGRNRTCFSVQFIFTNPENGRRMLAYITRDYNHAYYIDNDNY